MQPFVVRALEVRDVDDWSRQRSSLWPEEASDELRREAVSFLADGGGEWGLFGAFAPGGDLLGFVEARIRREAPGCTTDSIGYIEGWFVDASARRQGAGRALIDEAARWARARGCRELASDTTDRYPGSPAAHRGVGFRAVKTKIHFVRLLADDA